MESANYSLQEKATRVFIRALFVVVTVAMFEMACSGGQKAAVPAETVTASAPGTTETTDNHSGTINSAEAEKTGSMENSELNARGIESGAPATPIANSAPETKEPVVDTAVVIFHETEVIHFEWRPTTTFHGAYSLSDTADQHRIVIPRGIEKGKSYPVVIAFHGQPKRGKDPREYMFMDPVQRQVLQMVEKGEITPVILVMPVFRFLGTNWPKFNPAVFQKDVAAQLKALGVLAGEWYAFGHSGAAGCGGNGLNQIHIISPAGVGFFDTCLGEGWQRAVKQLQKAGVKTFNIHSVETAGFKPRQRPEYQADFDFGRAYAPLGIEPVECPSVQPGKKLRTLPYRCSATRDGVVQSFVVDTGEGVEAHKAVLEPAISYFLTYFLSKK